MAPNVKISPDAKRYSNLVYLHLRASIFTERKESVFHFEDEGNTLSEQKIMSLEDVNSMRELRSLKPYIVQKALDKQVITYKNVEKGEAEVVLPSLPPLTSIYETLMNIHLANDHAPSKLIKAQMVGMNPQNPSYKQIPNICYDLIAHFCKGCSKHHTGASVRGSVCFVYQLGLVSETYYTTLMIYIDENTEYMFFRPIHVTDFDAANELFKLFMQIGTPEEININHTCQTTCHAIQKKIEILCPSCEVIIESGRDDDKFLTRMILNEIGAWMKNSDSKIWQLGCSVIQDQMNKSIRAKIAENVPVTAYDLFYRNPDIFNPHGAKRWFPEIKRHFAVDNDIPDIFYCNVKPRLNIVNKDSQETSSRQEELKSIAIVPLTEEEASKINLISYKGRVGGHKRPKK